MELEISATASDLIAVDEEQQLIERAKRDREAFAVLYRRHYGVIASYVHRRVGDPHLTEDLVADVFMAALRSLSGYRHRSLPLKSWLYRIATNRVNRWVRRERRGVLRQLNSEPAVDPEAARNEASTAEEARLALLSVTPKYQAVLALHYLEGMPLADVARVIGCRQGTVKSRLARGRDELRQRLEQRRSRP